MIFRTPQHQLGQGRHRPEGPIRCERNTSPPRACRRGRPRSDHPAEQPIAEHLGIAPQAKVFAYSVVCDRNPVGYVSGEAAGEEVRGTFVVGILSDRSVCIKQVLVEVEAVEGFTPAGKPPPQLLGRSGIRSYGLVCCAQVIGATADVALRRRTKVLVVVFGWDGFRLDSTDLFCPRSRGRWCTRPSPPTLVGCRGKHGMGG